MKTIIDWIMANPVMALVILVIAIGIVVLIYKDRKEVLIKSALYIVAKVEEEWSSDMGRIKFAEAYSYIRTKHPVITFLLPEKKLEQIIEDALERLNAVLADKEYRDTLKHGIADESTENKEE